MHLKDKNKGILNVKCIQATLISHWITFNQISGTECLSHVDGQAHYEEKNIDGLLTCPTWVAMLIGNG